MDTQTRSQLFAQQTHYLSLLQGVRERYGKLSGVEWIGLGLKEKEGKLTADWAWRFYVKEKKAVGSLPLEEAIPSEVEGLATDVISHADAERLVTYPTDLNVDSTDYYDQGIRGGIQIRSEYFGDSTHSGYGTLGILARRKDDNALVGLTCAHVVNAGLVVSNSTGHKIGHPHHYVSPCCGCCSSQIGAVSAATATADLDCALIALDGDVVTKVTGAVPSSTENIIENDGADITITGATAAVIGETVRKRGRSTKLTTGTITDIAYGTDAMLIAPVGAGPFAVHGDSGAVIINAQDKVIGLLIAGDKETMTPAAPPAIPAPIPSKVTMGIATHIKKVMENLNITIAGTDAAFIGLPLDPLDPALDWKYWPGGNATVVFNPSETFASSEFGFAVGTAVDWNVATGGAGAVILSADGAAQAAGTTSVTNKISIVVRFNTTSTSKELANAVRIVAAKTGQPTASKFRTIFSVVARAINTSAALNARNTNVFSVAGGTVNNVAGVVIPGTNGATDFLARSEIIYDITPTDLDWGTATRVMTQVVTGNPPAAAKGNIRCKRQWKRSAGSQPAAGANRLHPTDEAGFADATESTGTEFMMDSAAPSLMFSNSSFGFSPTGMLQQYLRADFHEMLMIHDGSGWIQFTPNTEWFVNLTQPLAADPPAAIGAPLNHLGAGVNAEKVPNKQPVVVPAAVQEVRPGAAGVSISATVTDGDSDVTTLNWVQTSGTAVVLSSPTGSPVTFTAPATDGQLVFTPTAVDSTGALSRAPANSSSAAVQVVVNVVEIRFRLGGFPNTADNQTEAFTSAMFGLAGSVNWTVTGGAIIVETGGAAAPGLPAITVRYDVVSVDQTVANTIVITATQGANSFYKRRTVLLPEWAAWPGGQADTALNPTELISAADMGFAAGTLLNWDVRDGVPDGVIVGSGTTAVGVASVTVRLDAVSPSRAIADAVWIVATNPIDGQVRIKARTAFTITPQPVNTSVAFHADNALTAPATAGAHPQVAGVVTPGVDGATWFQGKQEVIYDIAPTGIVWSRRIVLFRWDDPGEIVHVAHVKFELTARREVEYIDAYQGPADANRVWEPTHPWGRDGHSDSGDCQYPTDALANRIFRMDAPGFSVAAQLQRHFRDNFREFIEFHNGTGWTRITPYALWFINLTASLSGTGLPPAVVGAPNTMGTGNSAVVIPNSRPVVTAPADIVVATGAAVSLTATVVDADDDAVTYTWTQTGGTPVIGGATVANPLAFAAPAAPTVLTFSVVADDGTGGLPRTAGNSASLPDTVIVTVT